ncbi:MAG: hypothetical protein RQ801_11250 [Spirochaetaceae bacterium]|nr:hypothetical protein [Spirochaetaceae bacterium]
MKSDIVKTTAKIFGGSAIAGMGFSLGRDVYSGAKKKDAQNAVIAIAIIAGAVVGLYSGGVWLFRNYRSTTDAVLTRLGAVLLIIPCYFLIWALTIELFRELKYPSLALSLPSLVLICGMSTGNRQRERRQKVWEAEAANREFMARNSLVEHEDTTIEDRNDGQRYRVDNVEPGCITLFPLGRRGKRAYIHIAPDGKYSEYTGMVKI